MLDPHQIRRQLVLLKPRCGLVTEVGMAAGFDNLGRMSRMYRELFYEEVARRAAQGTGFGIADLLRDEGYHATVAGNGREALEALEAADYNVVLLDVQMPELDGLEACTILRRQGMEVPIIAVSADALSTSKTAALDAGCDAYVTKPIDFDILLTELDDLLPEGEDPASWSRAFTETDLEAAAEYLQRAVWIDGRHADLQYMLGRVLYALGRYEEALEAYREAVEYDPEFGRAYAGMGVVYGNLRQEEKAEESYQQALERLDRMSERERYRTLGGYYLLVSHNFEKAIEISEGRYLMTKVMFADQYARLLFDRELHDKLLVEVMASDPSEPGLTLINTVAQRRAQELLDTADAYF